MKPVSGAVAASCIVAVAILLLSWTTYFAQLNSSAYDFTLRLAGPISPSSPTVIVAIDEDSIDRIGSWPWSRDKIARLIERIQSAGPKTIAVDLLLDDTKTDEEDRALDAAIAIAPSIPESASIMRIALALSPSQICANSCASVNIWAAFVSAPLMKTRGA